MILLSLLLFASVPLALAVNFDFEKIQLTEAETRNYTAVRFGRSEEDIPQEECRYIPGDSEWPTVSEWARFNQTLGGALLKPQPLASVCYSGPQYDANKCAQVKRGWGNTLMHANDPISVVSQWSSGYSCIPTSNPNSTCSQGGYPAYVVNATTVRHIQLAVNFARNQNIRLVIKNSGHDFNGKAVGGHSLSVWVHNIKSFAYHPNYTVPGYSGRAVSYGAGYAAMDGNRDMARYNMTFLVAGGGAVGIAGGFLQGGGHSSFTGFYGLAADQVLKIQAVVASGELVELDSEHNKDLFWAFRGGGGGTFGIITSVVVKAFPRTRIASGSISFSTVPMRGTNSTGVPVETFWEGVKAYWAYCIAICDAGGQGYNFIRHTPNPSGNSSGYTFTTSVSLPNRTAAEYRTFIRPLLNQLNALGIPVPLPPAMEIRSTTAHLSRRSIADDISTSALGENVSTTLIASRFFQRRNFNTSAALAEMHAAIRNLVQNENGGGGYTFHGINYSPTLAVAGNPSNAVNPAFRNTLLHAQGYTNWWDSSAPVVSRAEQTAQHDRLQSYLQVWRDITPGSGSYINEGDAQDPDWKRAFFGSNYDRLREVKEKWDPSGLFFAIGGVGSDEWEVQGREDGLVTQDGRLCRVDWERKV